MGIEPVYSTHMELTNTGENAMTNREKAIAEMDKIQKQIQAVSAELIGSGEFTGSEMDAFLNIDTQIIQLKIMMDKLNKRAA